MNKIKRIIHSNLAIVALLLILNIPVLLPLTRSGFFPTQDYIYVARTYEMKQALEDGRFPVRWAKDFRYGEPLYNFYAPLPYYVGGLIKLAAEKAGLALTYLETTKILFAVGFILSTLAMYLFAQNLFGRLGGILAAALYLWAPYHSVDVYVRGALSESWALIFFPLVFHYCRQIAGRPSFRNGLLLALSLAGLFYTHNIMTMLFMPFALIWMGFWILRTRQPRLSLLYLGATVWGVGMAASFLLPALLEKQYVQTDKLVNGYFNFRGHFVEVRQFFSTFWGYGASVWGGDDGMSFQVGLANWLVIGLSGLAALLSIIRNRFKKTTDRDNLLVFGMLFAMFVFSLFMQHNKSAFVWEKISLLWYTQFPWRFLGISIFLAAALGPFFLSYVSERSRPWLCLAGLALAIGLGIGYFHPESYYQDSKDSHYISKRVLAMENRLPKDYLPIWVSRIEPEKFSQPRLLTGQAEIESYHEKTARAWFNVVSENGAVVQTPLTFFPGWKAFLNGSQIPIEEPSDLGLIDLRIPPGSYTVSLVFADTPIRQLANSLSLLSLGLIPAGLAFKIYRSK